MGSVQNGTVLNGKTPESPAKSKSLSGPGKKEKPRRSYFRWSLALAVRLFIWYTVLTPFLQCPSDLSGLDGSSPRVCKPYLITRSYIDPHVDRYYQTYAAPYVDQARPYASTFNKRVYAPASKFAKLGYEAYGAPTIAHVSEYGHEKWESVVVPQLESIQARAQTVYQERFDPYVRLAKKAVTPYTDAISSHVTNIYEGHILPLYTRSKPFVIQTYSSGQDLLFGTVIPIIQEGWSTLAVFVKSNLVPTITGLYSQNVEPQLVKIGERLASYREGKKLRTVVDEFESSTAVSTTSTAAPSPTSINSSQTTELAKSTTQSDEVQASVSPEQQYEKTREQVASDLLLWQQKFATAADNGVDDLGERVVQIVNSQLESGARKNAESLVEELETVQEQEISKIKQHINSIIEGLPTYEAHEEEQKANDDLLQFIRSAGSAIKDRAHALREWYNGFDQELTGKVVTAAYSTLEVLDGIRDLGLQEIGMRWAWMDGVTYKDWEKYHSMRKQFDEWREEVFLAGVQHEKVEEARATANDILLRGMAIAEDAAKELSRLKEVGKWKIQAREISDDFETRNEPPPPLSKPEEDIVEESNSSSSEEPASETGESGEPPIVIKSITETSTVKIELADATPEPSKLSEFDESTDAGDLENANSKSSNGEKVDDDDINDKTVWGGVAAQVVTHQVPILDDDEENGFTEQIKSLASEAGERYAEATRAVGEALFAQPSAPSYGDQAASVARDQYSRALATASSVLYGTTPSVGEQIATAASEKYEQAVAAASSVFYNFPGTHTKSSALESVSSVAASRLQEGLSAATAQFASLKASITPTPTSTRDPIFLDAQRRYYEAIGMAHDRYSAFVSSASSVIFEEPTPTPTPPPLDPEALLENAISEYQYISGLASSSLAAVISSASSAAERSGGSARGVIDDALSRYSDAMSAASASLSLASESASSAIYGTPTGTFESITSQASERWESVISQASEQIYGTPAPYIQQLYDAQASRYQALESFVSELVVGKEPSFTESVMSRLRSAYETPYPADALSSASSYANEAYSSASSFVATHATPAPVLDDIVKAATEQLNSAVDAASGYVYGTSKGPYEQATSAAADAYSSASSHVSEAIYGTQPGYIEAARSQIDAAFSSAQIAISTAIYSTPTGRAEGAMSAASDTYDSVTSAVKDNVAAAESMMSSAYSNIHSQASAALLPEQQGALESATSKLALALESAQARLADLASNVGEGASKIQSEAGSVVETAQTVIISATSKNKDEL
ncbi:conserved hypothetical protein [Talaromyces stipitatus ATCC 10500]|uniref:Transcription factor hoxa13 n=1 Tax=Talaromyces stipitatus (strain ATCC 10500 / CBS 375.48 / QM 6759 / NRRL 1006) TaxID=441959 RepID=B8M2I3_TALSN|nr:uncharacterized protein TSTA_091350 [Talaromyces stipitatus ATCC 10500]EED21894.1 conserved hypothetical protein [Talaromyces stipitatus ATCC 10500]